MYNNKKISVIIPAFNEEHSISRVIGDISRDTVDEIIVVDNGSTDQTGTRAKDSGAQVVQEGLRGYGAACLKGLASVDGADIIVILDADYSDYPREMMRLIRPIADGEADFVLGSRMLGNREKGSLARQAYWGNKLATFLIRLLFGFKYTDMGPFRAIRHDSLKKLKMQDTDFGWNAEMQTKAIKAGLRIKEASVNYRKRIGDSKISGTVRGTVLAGSKIISTVIKEAFAR